MNERQRMIFQAAVQLAQGVLESDESFIEKLVAGIDHEILAKRCFKLAKELYKLSIND